MKYAEREAILENLPFESKLGYMAFCVERCLVEARLHPAAAQQLSQLPLLRSGLEILWDRAERGRSPSDATLQQISSHVDEYDPVDAPRERVVYRYDVTLVQAARMLRKALTLLTDPATDADFVAGALEGVVQAIGVIYADYRNARNAELAVIDEALVRLRDHGAQPFSRAVFAGIPEWTRGALSKKYAGGKIKGEGGDDEDDDE
jgi:hypothetical protein